MRLIGHEIIRAHVDHRAALAAGDVLGGVEGEDGGVTGLPRLHRVALALEAMRAVLDDPDMPLNARMRVEPGAQGRHIAHPAEEMHGDYRARARVVSGCTYLTGRNFSLQPKRVYIVGLSSSYSQS